MLVILNEVKDLLLILDSPQPEILRRCAPQDDKEGAILNEAIASPEGKDLLLILENLKTEILRPKTGLRMTNKGKRSLRSSG